MCDHSTKRLFFFDYLGDECAVPEHYKKYPILPPQNPIPEEDTILMYELEKMKRRWYGF